MGFPMRCDLRLEQLLVTTEIVSIPYGFSNALRRILNCQSVARQICFNPLWVFQCAATVPGMKHMLRWNRVSIPYGFSNALRLPVSLVDAVMV